MTDLQLYLAIGVPILFNLLGFTLLSHRISDLREDMRARSQHLEERWSG